MTTCQKNLLHSSILFNKPDEFSTSSEANAWNNKAIIQGNNALNKPGSTIPGSLTPASAFLLSTKEMF